MFNFIGKAVFVCATCVSSMASAAIIDLTESADPNNESYVVSTNLGDVAFEWGQFYTTGTGILDPFVRVQRTGDEQGYNTTQDSNGLLPFDESYGVWTHDVLISSFRDIDNNGTFQFVLDIGEPAAKTQSLLSLDGLKLFSTSIPGQNGNAVDELGNWVGPENGTLLWDLDADSEGNFVDNAILLDSNRNGNPGNGISDMYMDVATSIFDVAPSDQTYFILWSRFGLTADAGASAAGTFEEWSSVGAVVTPVPEPKTIFLLMLGLGLLFWVARKRKQEGVFLA